MFLQVFQGQLAHAAEGRAMLEDWLAHLAGGPGLAGKHHGGHR